MSLSEGPYMLRRTRRFTPANGWAESGSFSFSPTTLGKGLSWHGLEIVGLAPMGAGESVVGALLEKTQVNRSHEVISPLTDQATPNANSIDQV